MFCTVSPPMVPEPTSPLCAWPLMVRSWPAARVDLSLRTEPDRVMSLPASSRPSALVRDSRVWRSAVSVSTARKLCAVPLPPP